MEGESLELEAPVEVRIVGGCECSGRMKAAEESCRYGGEYRRRGRRKALPTVQCCRGQLIACAQKIASGSLGQYAVGFP